MPERAPAEPQALEVDGLSISLSGRPVLRDLALRVAQGRTLAVLGASGCGKTTLLRGLAGLLPIDAGTILLGGRSIARMPPRERGALYMYQEPLLFPHLDVFENIAFGLRLRGLPAPQVARDVEAMLERLSLQALARRTATQLSGGQRQRVAFGRALIVQPRLLLLDEPFGSLDPEARADMQRLFREAAQSQRITALFVTHDVKEALIVGNAFARLQDGNLIGYPDRAAFCADPDSGVARERSFWTGLTDGG